MITAGLGTTTSGLVWSGPTNAMGCSFQYIITLAADPDVTHTVETNSVSFSDLRAYGFPICVASVLTVTPRVLTSNTLLSNSSATIEEVVIASPGMYNYYESSHKFCIGYCVDVIEVPDVSTISDKLNVTVHWTLQVVIAIQKT